MAEVEVPGPESDWERALEYQGGKRNPAFQASMWEYAASSFRLVAGLSPLLDVLAARLRLNIERGWRTWARWMRRCSASRRSTLRSAGW
ncbi:hypothetical protein AB0H69_49280, partial [Streptomyces phaeochromogenes]